MRHDALANKTPRDDPGCCTKPKHLFSSSNIRTIRCQKWASTPVLCLAAKCWLLSSNCGPIAANALNTGPGMLPIGHLRMTACVAASLTYVSAIGRRRTAEADAEFQSYLDISTDGVARFHGNLDIETLGGAGFASQHTTGKDRAWDVDGYNGIQLEVLESDCVSDQFSCAIAG